MRTAIEKPFVRFVIVGIFSTLINYSVFYLCYEFLAFHHLLASGLGFFTGVQAGFQINKSWTFGFKEAGRRYLLSYFLVYSLSLILSLGFLELLVRAGIPVELAQLFCIGLTTMTNFIGIKYWAFQTS